MTYNELMNLNPVGCYVDTSVQNTIDTLKDKTQYADDNIPYTIERRLIGDVYIYKPEYITLILKALDTGCMIDIDNDWGNTGIDILDKYIAWQSTITSITPNGIGGDRMLLSLDNTLRSTVTCEVIPSIDDCSGSYTSSYVPCP